MLGVRLRSGRDGHLRAHVDDGGLQSTGDSGRVSIGDSTTNIITPMMSYFGLILALPCDTTKGGHRHVDFHDDSILHGVPVGLGGLVLRLGLRLGLPVGPGTPTYYP